MIIHKLIFHLYSLLLLSLLFKSIRTLRIKSCAANNLFSQRSRKLCQRKFRFYMYSGRGDIVGLENGPISSDINGNIYGMVCGDVFGDINGNIYGRIKGNVNGNIYGQVCGWIGNVNGNIFGQVSGIVDGSVRGDINGDVSGIIKGDVTGIINGYVTGSVEGKVGGGTNSLNLQKKLTQLNLITWRRYKSKMKM